MRCRPRRLGQTESPAGSGDLPVPADLLARFDEIHAVEHVRRNANHNQTRIWVWSRTIAWLRVKTAMRSTGIVEVPAVPKALRHAFGVGGTQAGVLLNLIQRWLGHSDIQTTAIYTDVMGDEERVLADRTCA